VSAIFEEKSAREIGWNCKRVVKAFSITRLWDSELEVKRHQDSKARLKKTAPFCPHGGRGAHHLREVKSQQSQ